MSKQEERIEGEEYFHKENLDDSDFDCIDDHTKIYVFDIRDALNTVVCPPLSFDQKYSIFCLLNIWEEEDRLLREEGEQHD
jgi:hypothetical protein